MFVATVTTGASGPGSDRSDAAVACSGRRSTAAAAPQPPIGSSKNRGAHSQGSHTGPRAERGSRGRSRRVEADAMSGMGCMGGVIAGGAATRQGRITQEYAPCNGRGGDRTRTEIPLHGILSPVRLPVSPLGRPHDRSRWPATRGGRRSPARPRLQSRRRSDFFPAVSPPAFRPALPPGSRRCST